MALEYTTTGGVGTLFGPLATAQGSPFGARESTYGNYVEIEYDFDYTNLPAWSASNLNDARVPQIDAYSVIESAVLLVGTPWVGGTALEVGTFDAVAGTAVDADGLIPAAVGVLANLNAAGEGVYGIGIQCLASLYNTGGAAPTGIIAATNTTGATKTVIGVVATGTFTAGTAKLIVRYLKRPLAA